ncbi:MAG: PEP-CTERM sorting domain-containing protein [Planctomycetaceae bacterium]|nr:PEP-CTERM sorting domain-containing protein [Planctomycetaceae bacterium]
MSIKQVDSYNLHFWLTAVSTFVASSESQLGQGFGMAFYNEIPEPATMSLLVIGGIAALIRRRKKYSDTTRVQSEEDLKKTGCIDIQKPADHLLVR